MNKNVKIFFFLYKNSTASSVDYKLLESLRVQHMETNIFHLYTIVWVVLCFFFVFFFYKGSLEKISSHKLFKRDYRLSTIQ